MFGLLIAGGGLLALFMLIKGGAKEDKRTLWLISGKRYNITIYEPNVTSLADLDSMFTSFGFCNIESITPLPPGGIYVIAAYWCQQNTLWEDIPENISVD